LGLGRNFAILCFGTIRRYKGYELLIEAFKRLPEECRTRMKYVIVGGTWRGETEKIVERLRREIPPQSICIDCRYVSKEELGLYFSACDAVVLPYLSASQSGVARIAMAYGKPIIASDVGDMAESSRVYQGLTVFPSRNSDALAASIQTLLTQEPHAFPRPKELSADWVLNELWSLIRAQRTLDGNAPRPRSD